MSANVLVVEDDAAIRRGLSAALDFAGFHVIECTDGKAAVRSACERDLDLVILDLMLPLMDGFSVLAELKRIDPALPVIIVTARGAEEDRVRGLEEGADDYVVKPFSAKELLARVTAVLRRSPERSSDVTQLIMGDLRIDLARHEASRDGGPALSLADRDVAILRYLAVSRGRAIDRGELLLRLWGVDPRGVHTRTVDMQIARLREKLRIGDDPPDVIRTVRHKGYLLADGVQVVER